MQKCLTCAKKEKLKVEKNSNRIFCNESCQSRFYAGKSLALIEGQTKRGRDEAYDENIKKIDGLHSMLVNAKQFLSNNSELIEKIQTQLEIFYGNELAEDIQNGNVELLKYILDNQIATIEKLAPDIILYAFTSDNREQVIAVLELLKVYKINVNHEYQDGFNIFYEFFLNSYYGSSEKDSNAILALDFLINLGYNLNFIDIESNYTVLEIAILTTEYIDSGIIAHLIMKGAAVRKRTVAIAFKEAAEYADGDTEFGNYVEIIELIYAKVSDFNFMQRGFFSSVTVPKLRLLLIKLIIEQRRLQGLLGSFDISKKVNAIELRNFLCKTFTADGDDEEDQKDYLLKFCKVLGVPKDVRSIWKLYPVGKLCSYLSTILAIGAIWDDEKFLKQRENFEKLKKYELNRVRKFIDNFREGLEKMFDIDTDGKDLQDLIEEFEQA